MGNWVSKGLGYLNESVLSLGSTMVATDTRRKRRKKKSRSQTGKRKREVDSESSPPETIKKKKMTMMVTVDEEPQESREKTNTLDESEFVTASQEICRTSTNLTNHSLLFDEDQEGMQLCRSITSLNLTAQDQAQAHPQEQKKQNLSRLGSSMSSLKTVSLHRSDTNMTVRTLRLQPEEDNDLVSSIDGGDDLERMVMLTSPEPVEPCTDLATSPIYSEADLQSRPSEGPTTPTSVSTPQSRLGFQVEMHSLTQTLSSTPYQDSLWHVATKSVRLNPETKRLIEQFKTRILPKEEYLYHLSLQNMGMLCILVRGQIVDVLKNDGELVDLICRLCKTRRAAKDCPSGMCVKCCTEEECIRHEESRQQAIIIPRQSRPRKCKT